MEKLNGTGLYTLGIIVIAIATIGAVLYLSPNPNNNQEIISIVGFAAVLAKGLKDSSDLAAARVALKETNKAVVAVAEKTDLVAAKVDTVAVKTDSNEAKLDIVHAAVNGLNKAALENQALVSDRGGFDRGVAGMTEAIAATAPSEATPLIPPTYNPRDAAPPTQQNMARLGHSNREEFGVFDSIRTYLPPDWRFRGSIDS